MSDHFTLNSEISSDREIYKILITMAERISKPPSIKKQITKK
jgi:hypothetical protein